MSATIHCGHVLEVLQSLPEASVQCVITSPPYFGLRHYKEAPLQWEDGWVGCLGNETTPEHFIAHLVQVFRAVKRVLRHDGTLWLNIGDSYAGNTLGLKPKDLIGIPWMLAFALRANGWYLRQEIIWAKGISFIPTYSGSTMPESVEDRPTRGHEQVFLFAKSPDYYYDIEAVKEQGFLPAGTFIAGSDQREGNRLGLQGAVIDGKRNLRSVWAVTTIGFDGAFCTACQRFFDGADKSQIQVVENRNVPVVSARYDAVYDPTDPMSHNGTPRNDGLAKLDGRTFKVTRTCPCGRSDAWLSHFATFPENLIIPMVKAGAPEGGVVLDPFSGSGTTGIVALGLGRQYLGIELNPDYAEMSRQRIANAAPLLNAVETRATARTAFVAEPPRPQLSALDFALGPRSEAPPEAVLEGPSEAPVEAPTPPLEAPGQPVEAFRAELASRGHRLLLKEGKFFVSEASTLTEADRAFIKDHRDAVIALAEPWVEPLATVISEHFNLPTLFAEASTITLAQYLGTAPPRPHDDFRPDEPPVLDGIEHVVLNFATDGLDWARGHRPVGVTVSTLDGQLTRFLPFKFRYGGNLDEDVVKRWAQEQLKHKKISNANTKFDVHMARVWGLDLEAQGCTFSDVQHTAALLDDSRKKVALDQLARDYLPGNLEVPRVDEMRHHEYHAAEVAPREYYTAQLVGRLLAVMNPKIEAEDLRRVHDLEDAVIPVVVEMEKNGAPINVPLLKQWCAETARIVEEGLEDVAGAVGFQVNPDSNTDWQRLFEYYKIPFGGMTEGGKPSFTDAILKHVANPYVQTLRRVGKMASLRAKFLTAYDEAIGEDGILRYNLHQMRHDNDRGVEKGTVRGRFSASDKNIQQVMNHDTHIESFGSEDYFVRRLFLPGSGLLFAADAAQIEFRLFAHYSDSERLLKAYAEDPWVSYHRVAEGILRPYRADMPYTKIKSMNFLFVYGGGKTHAAEYLELPQQTSDEFYEIYHQAFPEVRTLSRKAQLIAQERGYVKSILGRRARFPDKKFAYKALNAVIQPTAADIFKQKAVEVHAERKRTGFVLRMPVHDELVGDAPDQESAAMVTEILNRQSFPLKVPILWSGKTGLNWAECK